jgi:transcriptional regulator with XRE-family HTH domain
LLVVSGDSGVDSDFHQISINEKIKSVKKPYFSDAFDEIKIVLESFLEANNTVKRSLIDYYETRSPNPALDFIERAAAALEVTVAELLGSEPNAARAKPGPASQLQRKFEQVKLLPREKQKFILQFLDTVLESSQQKQKA